MVGAPVDEDAPARTSGPRDIAAAASVFVPLGVTVVSINAWWDSLPSTLPRQWDTSGVSSTMPLWAFSAIILAVLVALGVGAVFTIPDNAAPNRRRILYWTGAASAFAASLWLIIAGVTLAAGPSGEPQIGGLPLLALVVSGLFGLAPLFIATRWHEPPAGL